MLKYCTKLIDGCIMSKSNTKLSLYQRFGRWILENRIKAQPKMRLPTAVQEDGIVVVNPSSFLFSWLSLAKLCSLDEDANLLGYQFSNNQSLAAFLIAEQESAEAKIIVKQNATLNFALLCSTQNQGEKKV